MPVSSIIIIGLLSISWSQVAAQNGILLEKIAANAELSEIYGMLERSDYNGYLSSFGVTLFAPTNEAFQKYKNVKDELLLGYHILSAPYNLGQLPVSTAVATVGSGNPPIFVTKTRDNEYYVNNAKIMKNNSSVLNVPNKPEKKKVLHIISDVIQPLRPKSTNEVKTSPSAFGLLDGYADYDLGPYQINNFANRVRSLNRKENFRNSGPNTYFIPVDESGKRFKADLIDEEVIDAHVIYNKVLFLNPTPENEVFETAAFSDSIKVVASIPSDTNNGFKKRYARSNTIVGSLKHSPGAVISEIVYPNIPVQNGVVHLIKQPLMVIDKTIQQLLDENTDGLVSIFKEKLNYAGEVFRQKLTGQQSITLFVPTNTAWRDLNVERAISNDTSLLRNILDFHLISEQLPINIIRERGSRDFPTLWKNKYLHFNLIIQGANHTLTIDGGGVNATVLHADLRGTNGVIHIIDRVLGIPYATMGRKMATDPNLNITYNLGNIPYAYGKYRNFNDRLDDRSKNYTYFVPRDAAWKIFAIQQEALNAALWQPGIAYQFLEKHLIEDRNYTMADLIRMLANETYLLQTKSGGLNIKVREGPKGYEIFWSNEWVDVYRPDVRCTNGIIHIIDKVLISPNDIKISINGEGTNFISLPVLLLFILPFGMIGIYH